VSPAAERWGVGIGARVVDLDGRAIGAVTDLYDEAFRVARGPPVLFRQEQVILYDEIRAVRDGALVVARSRRTLPQLAEGELPDAWRVPAPPGFPVAATPSEAGALFEELAAARSRSAWPEAGVEPPSPPAAEGEPERPEPGERVRDAGEALHP